MKATLTCLGVLLLAGSASAQGPGYYPYYPMPRMAPDACGPGYYSTNACGLAYGPGYCFYPAFPPYNGERPSLPGKGRPQEFGPSQPVPAAGTTPLATRARPS